MHLTALTYVEMDDRDNRIATLGRGLGALRLALGEGLLRLSAGDIQDFGYPTFESYVREALGRTGRWGADVRGLARRLASLPHLRAALASGRLSLSVVELVARIASPLDDAEWVDRVDRRVDRQVDRRVDRRVGERLTAPGMNVRQLRAELKARKLDVPDDTTPARVRISRTVDRIDAWAFEHARIMVEAVGARRGDEAIEAMLAEGLGSLLASDPDIDLPASLVGEPSYEGADDRALRLELEVLRERAEGAVEAMRPNDDVALAKAAEGDTGAIPATLVVSWPDDDDPAAPAIIDRQLRALAATLALRDIELGELACTIVDREVWRTFGYASFDHYCRERIGLSPSSVASRIALTRRFTVVPEVRAALAAGRICYESAALIARAHRGHGGPTNVQAWIEHATQRTVKQLREDLDASELIGRIEGRNPTEPAPPDADTRAAAADIERAVIATITGLPTAAEGDMAGLAETPASQTSDEIFVPTPEPALEARPTTLHLSLSEATGQFWRALEQLHGQMSGGAPFVPFLVRAVLDTWRGTIDASVAYADVYLRDRWRCASPVCGSRNVTPHHIVLRSHGGGDERTNLISLCERCHLELVHRHKLRVTGLAPHDLAWHARTWESAGANAPERSV